MPPPPVSLPGVDAGREWRWSDAFQRFARPPSLVQLYLIAAVCRLTAGLLVVTAFNPDEFWQNAEVAHHRAFGYGYVTWEWRDGAEIRSYAQPGLLAIWYRILALCGADSQWIVAHSPRIWQSLLAAFGDVYVYRLTARVFGARAGQFAYFSALCDWFMAYCIVRPFTNSIETVLTTVALYYWPFPTLVPAVASDDMSRANARRSQRIALAVAGLGCVFRPTNALIWFALAVHYIGVTLSTSDVSRHPAPGAKPAHFPTRIDRVLSFVGDCVWIGSLVLACCVAVDYIGYGHFTFSAWNFLRTNSAPAVTAAGSPALPGLAALYGTHPWHWYLTGGWTTITSAFLPVWMFSIVHLTRRHERRLQHPARVHPTGGESKPEPESRARRYASALTHPQFTLFWLWAWTLFVYSFNAHKEFRFILPVLPCGGFVYCGYGLSQFESESAPAATASADRHRDDDPSPLATPPRASGWRVVSLRSVIAVLVVSNVAAFTYFGRWHQAGPISAMNYLSEYIPTLPPQLHASVRVDFLTDCHAAPAYSYLHYPAPFPRVPIRTLDCAPIPQPNPTQIAAAARGAYNPHLNVLSSAYRFKSDPEKFAREFYSDRARGESDSEPFPLPSHLVVYSDPRLPLLRPFVDRHYRELASFFHSITEDETRMLVFELKTFQS